MIITLKGANFKTNNLGTINSWFITANCGTGATYEGPKSVEKGTRLTATITLADGYMADGGISVVMGTDITSSAITTVGNVATIDIQSVTDHVVINYPTKVKPIVYYTCTINKRANDADKNIAETSTISLAEGRAWNAETFRELGELEDIRSGIYKLIFSHLEPASGVVSGDFTVEAYFNVEEAYATLTINATPAGSTVIMNGVQQSSITVEKGENVTWSVSNVGYTTHSGEWPVTATETRTISLPVIDDTQATLSVTAYPSDAQIITYSKNKLAGGATTVGTGYVTVDSSKGENPTWQVTKDGYISNGGTAAKLSSNLAKDVVLQPFSTGNWVTLDTSTYEEVADYFMASSGKNSGPYNTWKHLICPIIPGKKYRIGSTAGQNALLWMFFDQMPDGSTGTVKPIKVSPNTGMTTKIFDEVVAPEGAQYLVVNGRINSADYKPTIERLDD